MGEGGSEYGVLVYTLRRGMFWKDNSGSCVEK